MAIISRAVPASPITPAGTAATIFPASSYNGTGTVTASTSACTLIIPGSSRFDGQNFFVRASGYATVGATASPTFNVTLYSGTSLTVGSDTLVKAGAAQNVTISTSFSWTLEARLIGDSTSNTLNGFFTYLINNLPATQTFATITQLTSQSFTAEPAFNFVIGGTFGVADASNKAVLTQFYAAAD